MPDIESPRMMEVGVTGPDGANRLLMISGVASFNRSSNSDDRWEGWVGEPLTISLLPLVGDLRIYRHHVVSYTATAALASLSFSETRRRDNWGYAVDAVEAFFSEEPADFADFGLIVDIALRGFSTRLFRISFQLNVLLRP
jgi:hypothetical protein